MATKNVPWWVATILVGAFSSALYGFATRNIDETEKQGAKIWSSDDCLQCHRDAKTILKMQSKRGSTEYCNPELQALLLADKQSKKKDGVDGKSYTESW